MQFDAWLRTKHYQESTIKQTLSDLKRVGVGGTQDPNVLNALRRYNTFANEFQIEDDLTEAAIAYGIGGVKRLPKAIDKKRKNEARSFEDDDWSSLVEAVQAGATKDPPDRRDQVLWAMVTTALRVGDVLRVERRELQAWLDNPQPELQVEVKGGTIRVVPVGVRMPWFALARGVLATKAKNVAQYVCPGAVGPDVRGSCAYHRVNRRLKALKRQLELAGRANTHRIRRTMAVKTLETSDLQTTQQMLGHTSDKATKRYVDEVNSRKLARIQRQLAGLE